MFIVIWCIFIILLIIYCLQEKQEHFAPATTLKVLLSAFIALVAVVAAFSEKNFIGTSVALGLCFAVPADYFLQYIRSDLKKYRLGILCFGCMHSCLLVGFYITFGISWIEFVVAVVMLALLTVFQLRENWNLGPAKKQLSLYTVLVVMMASKTISICIQNPSAATFSLALGGLFFFISDLFLGIWDYYKDKFVFLALNRVIYFAGQLLIAQSLLLHL